MTQAQTIYRFTTMNRGTSVQEHPGATQVNRKNRFFRMISGIRPLSVNLMKSAWPKQFLGLGDASDILMKKVNGFSWYLQNFLWTRQNQLNRSLQNHGE